MDNRRQRGIAAVESIMAMALFGVLMTGLSGSLSGTFRFMEDTKHRETLSRRALLAGDKLATNLRGIVQDRVFIANDGATQLLTSQVTTDLYFSRVVGVDEVGQAQASEPVRFFWEMDEGELDDGIDNDRDGLVDEGSLLFVNETGVRNLIADGVAENGFRVESLGDGFLTVTVKVQLIGTNKELLEREFSLRIPLE